MRFIGNVRHLLGITWPLVAAVLCLMLVASISADIMSAVRAYLTGESHWSKGQKDAIFHLTEYARRGDPRSYAAFEKALSAPLGDRLARLALSSPHPDLAEARRGFAQGLVKEDDIDGVIALFRWFGDSYLMAPSISLWTRGDAYIAELQEVGIGLRAARSSTPVDAAEVERLVARIETINTELTPLTVDFSEELARAAKRTQSLLLVVMLIATLILVPAGLWLAGRFMVRSQRLAIENDGLKREVDIAAKIQSAILPNVGRLPHLDVAARMVPAATVGGDCYDVQPAPDGCWIAIGDVAGHGLSTGLVTMMTQSALATVTHSSPQSGPAAAVCAINAVLYDNVRLRMKSDDHVTFVLLRTFNDGRVLYAGAHEELVVWRQSTGRCETVLTRGTWLGPRADITATTPEAQLTLAPGDLLVLYTDGVVEASNAHKVEFGLERLCAVIEAHAREPVSDIVASVFERVNAWAPQQHDDVTALVMRYQPPAAPAAVA